MPIQFEEVTGEIQREPAAAPAPQAQPAKDKPAEDLIEQIDRALRRMDERRARLCAD